MRLDDRRNRRQETIDSAGHGEASALESPSACLQVAGGQAQLQRGALPSVLAAIEAFLEPGSQRADPGAQCHQGDGFGDSRTLRAREHLVYPWLQMSRDFLQGGEAVQQVGPEHCGELMERSPAAEYLHRGSQHPFGVSAGSGIGCLLDRNRYAGGCCRDRGRQDVHQSPQYRMVRERMSRLGDGRGQRTLLVWRAARGARLVDGGTGDAVGSGPGEAPSDRGHRLGGGATTR